MKQMALYPQVALKFYEACIQSQIDADRQYHADNGYEFDERTTDKHTIGDFVRACMAIDSADDAMKFYHGEIAWFTKRFGKCYEEAVLVARANISWCFGEGMESDKCKMWRSVCDAAHPIFG